LYRLKNRLKNLGRYFFFSLGKWRLKNEVFFWSGLDFVGLKFLFNVERVGSKIIQSRIMQKLMR
jgi:hypothetical protein